MVWYCGYKKPNSDGSVTLCGTKFRDNRNINQVTCPTCGTSGSVCCISPYSRTNSASSYVVRDLT